MTDRVFYNCGTSAAMGYAEAYLKRHGCRFSPVPEADVTHLLLDVPYSGDPIPSTIPRDATIIGGRLGNLSGIDLLKSPDYLAENADITAHCAVKILLQKLPVTLKACPILVIGWGRIGKCLSQLLRNMGAHVTIAARKPEDRAIIEALGYHALDTAALDYGLVSFRVLINTAPTIILDSDALSYCQNTCLKIDLASNPGIEGSDVLWARGLPSKEAPESSGILIGKTILRLIASGKDVSS